ncbi:MAG: 2-oxoacid:acceptor oxidoreductase family protein [Desulfurococcales archaeon]|nr:2-oxoacid:acceptor oxidoreductase family protein [Desulfurococcales archaeon]
MGSRIEIRWHGRGGQGAVTAATVLAEAAVMEGLYAQAFPEFGAERRGAPVKAYNRVGNSPIRTRAPIRNPDVVVVLDTSLPPDLYMPGLKEDGYLIVNIGLAPEEFKSKLGINVKVAAVNATKIALDVLGVPIVNMAMLGALLRVTKVVGLKSIEDAVMETFGGRIGEKNVEAIRRAFNLVEVV